MLDYGRSKSSEVVLTASEIGLVPEYRAAQEFREACFASDGSFLYPGRAIWTIDALQASLAALSARDAAPEGARFTERLRLQLTTVDEATHVLIAETLILYYLFPASDAIKKTTKIDRVREVLSWRDMPLPEDRIAAAFGNGIGGVGTHYLSAQPFLMSFFLQFALTGKNRGIDFSSRISCQEIADKIRSSTKNVVEARHALLHLLFPADYAPIVSDRHKGLIVAKYGQDGDESDQDLALQQIRERLSRERGHNISFYEEALRSDWDAAVEPHVGVVPEVGSVDTIPNYERLMLPFLQLIADGDSHREADLIEPLARQFDLMERDLNRRLKSGPGVFANRVKWAKVNLRQAGLLEIPGAGNVRLTSRGRELLAENPESISRAFLRRYPEYVDFLNRSKDAEDGVPAAAGNVWIEKTIVEGRTDRQSGEYALGRMLWSPDKNKEGRDIYRFMRDVRPGDVVLHLTDNRGFTGASIAAGVAEPFVGLAGTEWADRPALRVRLEQFKPFDPPLLRDSFFASPFRERLIGLRRAGQRNLFYTEGLELVQGGYLTPVSAELMAILNDAYTDLTGEQLVGASALDAVTEEIAPNAYPFELLLEKTLWPEDTLNELLDSLSTDRPIKQLILAGPPGTGKTWVAKEVVRHLCEGDDERWRLVQFHPSYSYEQFIEGLRPVTEGGGIAFKPVSGILLQIADLARKSQDSHFLIIDEMNRANLPRVLGELLYLFEYRQATIDLPYTSRFTLPEKLFFVGTMNTADRSIRSIDTALRRRFEIFECLPSRTILEKFYSQSSRNQVSDLFTGFENLNELLEAKLDRHHTIGHTFFMSKTVFSPKQLRIVWQRQIRPLIEEYFFDQPDQVEAFKLEALWPSLQA